VRLDLQLQIFIHKNFFLFPSSIYSIYINFDIKYYFSRSFGLKETGHLSKILSYGQWCLFRGKKVGKLFFNYVQYLLSNNLIDLNTVESDPVTDSL